MYKKNNNYIFQMVMTSLLIAMKIVLDRFLSYNIWNQRFGFSFIAVAFAACFFGSISAMLVAGIGDIIGAILFPVGPYFPGFTLTAVLMALCTSFFIHKNATFLKISISVIINQLFGSILLNTLWISILYGSNFYATVLTRLTQVIFMTVIQVILIYLLFGEKSILRRKVIAICKI